MDLKRLPVYIQYIGIKLHYSHFICKGNNFRIKVYAIIYAVGGVPVRTAQSVLVTINTFACIVKPGWGQVGVLQWIWWLICF